MDTVVKPRYDTERIFRATQPTAARNDEKKLIHVTTFLRE
nr:hypothetical protein [Rickettsia monacensis]